MIHFTADPHFLHANSLNWEERKNRCGSIEEQDATIIKQWNSVVESTDEIYMLGDFTYRSKTDDAQHVFNQLQGIKHLIIGNHEKVGLQLKGWSTIRPYHELLIKEWNKYIILFHYPIESWNGAFHGSWHLHGHVHGRLNGRNKSILRHDVCVENNNWTPYSLSDIELIMNSKTL